MAPNSRVQDLALEVLAMTDQTDRERERLDRVKALVVSFPPGEWERVAEQFPEYFPAKDPFEAARTDVGYDIDKIDDSLIEWGVADVDEDEEMSRWIAEHDSGFVTGDDLGGTDWV